MEQQVQQEKINPINLMTVNDYARMMGKTPKTIYNWIEDKKIAQVDYLGKKWIDKSTYKG